MADRYSFQSPFSRGSDDDPWFTLGSIGVTTTAAISGLAILGLFLLALEQNGGPVGSALFLNDSALFGGEIWRLFTWPVVLISSRQLFGQFISAIFFYSIGTQLERRMGRKPYLWTVGIITVAPALLATLISQATGIGLGVTGLSVMFLGVAVGFAAMQPRARSFFGIPFWVLVAAIFGISVLSDLADGNYPLLIMHIASAALGLVLTRSMGLAPEVDWAPEVPLPASMSPDGAPRATKPAKTQRRSKKKKKASESSHLRSVPAPTSRASEAEIDALLDQVNEQGLNSLTKQQKQTLERHAQEMRKRRDQG